MNTSCISRMTIALHSAVVVLMIGEAVASPSKVFVRFPSVIQLDSHAKNSLTVLAVDMLVTSSFNSSMHPKIFPEGVLEVHRSYRTAVGGSFLVVTFEKPQEFKLGRGNVTATEIVIGLNHARHADSLFTIDTESRIVEHRKYEGYRAINLLEAVKREVDKVVNIGVDSAGPQQDQSRAIAALKNLGGRIRLDKNVLVMAVGLDERDITDADLIHLAAMANLKTLSLRKTKVTDKGLEQLKELKALTTLYLPGTNIGDGGLKHLGEMTQLTNLYLQETEITDTGLEHLKGLSNLRTLYLNGTDVTDAGVKLLEEALPECTIKRSAMTE